MFFFKKLKSSPTRERMTQVITKFRTNVGKLGPDKVALSSYIRLFEPMVIKALKVFSIFTCCLFLRITFQILFKYLYSFILLQAVRKYKNRSLIYSAS